MFNLRSVKNEEFLNESVNVLTKQHSLSSRFKLFIYINCMNLLFMWICVQSAKHFAKGQETLRYTVPYNF